MGYTKRKAREAEAKEKASVKGGGEAGAESTPNVEVVGILSLDPRLHNIISYFNTILVFIGTLSVTLASHSLHFVDAIVCFCFVVHFARRTLESAYLHVYSRGRIAFIDWIVEYIYYWVFAAWLALSLPLSEEISTQPVQGLRLLGLCLWLLGEFGNFRSHMLLSQLRSSPALKKKIILPTGFLFDFVSSPHYFFEIMSWVGFALLTQFLCMYIFLALTTVILFSWGTKRHNRYKQIFGSRYPKERKAVIPFLI